MGEEVKYDAIIIGSGINSLVAGAVLSKSGWRVLICERNDRAGGAIRTEQATLPGFTHELLSSWHPLFVGGPAYALLKEDLENKGLLYKNTELPTGVICKEGSAILFTDPNKTIAEFSRLSDGDSWSQMMAEFMPKIDLAFGLLGADLWRASSLKLARSAQKRFGNRGLVATGAELLEPAQPWLDRQFTSPISKALLAPWALHNGMGPDDAGSAFITKVISAAIALGGMPVPVGGGIKLVDALLSIIADHGGKLQTNADVTKVLIKKNKAYGVELSSGEIFTCKRAVLASTTPQVLYQQLLSQHPVSAEITTAAKNFRYGRAAIQIHLALSEPPIWKNDPRMKDVAIVHVLDGVGSLSESVNAANRGFLPARPTIVVGQPCTVDSTRAPDGKSIGITMNRESNIENLKKIAPEDVESWKLLTDKLIKLSPHLFPILSTELPSLAAAKLLFKSWRAIGTTGLFELIRLLLQSSRSFADEYFVHKETKALAATWGMHLDYGPDISGGALFSFLESIGGQEFGMVLGKGGADSITTALTKIIVENGGEVLVNSKVTEILLKDGKAIGVVTADGKSFKAESIIANVNPALIPNLLPVVVKSDENISKIKNFKPGLGTMMIHLALSDPPTWRAAEAGDFNYVHIAPYIDDMAMTYAMAAAGKLPEQPTLVIGQPTVSDPSRAPNGKHILWIQVRVLPLEITGDASGEIDGKKWDDIGEQYADRVINIIEEYAPGLKNKILARKVLTPSDLERYNVNLIKGDSLGGSHHPSQFFFLRPIPGWTGHKTPIKNLYICGSGTWPGGGVGGGSGLMVANLLSK